MFHRCGLAATKHWSPKLLRRTTHFTQSAEQSRRALASATSWQLYQKYHAWSHSVEGGWRGVKVGPKSCFWTSSGRVIHFKLGVKPSWPWQIQPDKYSPAQITKLTVYQTPFNRLLWNLTCIVHSAASNTFWLILTTISAGVALGKK